jgi:hypothetical protein
MFDMSVGALQQFVEYYILKGFVVQRAFSVRTKSFSAHCTVNKQYTSSSPGQVQGLQPPQLNFFACSRAS